MRNPVFAAVAAALCFVASAAVAAPPVEAFGNLPALTRVHLSPDGKHFSAIEPLNGRPTVVVFALDAPTQPVIFGDPESFAEDSIWVNNDRLICIVYGVITENTRKGLEIHRWSRAIAVSISGKEPVVLLKRTPAYRWNRSAARVVGLDADDPNVAYMALWRVHESSDSYYALDLLKVNVETGSIDLVQHGNGDSAFFVMDGHGHAAARVDEKFAEGTFDMKDDVYLYDGDRDHKAYSFDASKGWEAQIGDLTMDGSALVVQRYDDHGKISLDALPLNGTGAPSTLLSDPNYDFEGDIVDEWTGRMIGGAIFADREEDRYLDPRRAKLQRGLDAALPSQTVRIVSVDKAGTNVIVSSEDPQNPRTYWLYNSQTHEMKALAQQYPTLQPSDLGEMKVYRYKAADGLEITSYLTLPPGKSSAKNLPLVVLPHGGPEARDALGFDWMAQFLASRGYAVLQPNFRGSAGYGKKFVDAGNGQWGLKMQSDISDGVRKAIADGIADPKRVCIVGASYGGYASLAGATFTPELYACAVSIAGISSVPNIVGQTIWEEGAESSGADYWKQRIGDISSNEQALLDVSPASHAANVRAPILLIHDDKDTTVKIDQSILENSALKKAGKDVQFITIDGDDHYLNLASTRIRVLKEIETFLDAHIGH
ncbi:MAG TPA: S9 family peptidase [Rhizomicrobium sp.]|jgi:dipeptidyl aminopeptidase/acylaminoacyl peptidase